LFFGLIKSHIIKEAFKVKKKKRKKVIIAEREHLVNITSTTGMDFFQIWNFRVKEALFGNLIIFFMFLRYILKEFISRNKIYMHKKLF